MEETTKTYGFTGNLAAKVGAFILAVILFVITVSGCLGAYLMLENDFYTVPEEQAVESVLGSAVTSSEGYTTRTSKTKRTNQTTDTASARCAVS